MKIIYRNDAGFEEAIFSRVFNNKRPIRKPILIAYPENDGDAVEIVKYAVEHNYKISVRAGGHSWAIWSVRDEAILVDMQHFTNVEIDQKTWIAKVQPAVRNLDLQPILEQYGRFFGGGHCPTVAVGGFLLQGGQGWLARSRGWSAEQIVGIDVVTADGELVHANASQNSDLYWSARGAGPGFFGLITCFHLQTSPAKKLLMASTYLFPNDLAKPILRWLQEMHQTVATSIELVALGQSVKSAEIGINPENALSEYTPVILIHALAFVDTEAEGEKDLKVFKTCPFLSHAYIKRQTYLTNFEEQFELQLAANPESHRWAVSNAWLQGSAEEVSETIAPLFSDLPNPKAFTLWYSMAPLRPLPDMAFSMQTEIYLASYVLWKNEDDDEYHQQWLSKSMQSIAAVTAGQYLGDSDFQVLQRKFLSNENWEKLKTIQSRRDPNAVFVGYLTNDKETLNTNQFL